MIPNLSERALILAPLGRDAKVAAEMLGETGIASTICPDIAALIGELESGAGFGLVTDEALLSPDLRDLNYGKFVEQGEQRISGAEDYTSANTQRLDVEGMKRLLLKLDFIRDLVAGRPAVPVD